MERRFRSHNVFKTDHEENGTIRTPKPENLVELLPATGAFAETMKSPSTSSPRGSKRSLKKKVISIPIKEAEGSPHKAGEGVPPSDSWAWRKYGQKPIKGSPYPRGYCRCSSSKGCPARKQVERSRDDPTMLVITYSCEHNHPWPTPRNSRHHQNHRNVNAAAGTTDNPPDKPESTDVSTLDVEGEQDQEPEPETESAQKFASRRKDGSPLMAGEDEFFGWFTDMEMATSSVFESPVFDGKIFRDDDPSVALLFPTRGEEEEEEEDESLFADLGELPECSVVFRHLDEGTQVQIC